jgi:hypothetical protein
VLLLLAAAAAAAESLLPLLQLHRCRRVHALHAAATASEHDAVRCVLPQMTRRRERSRQRSPPRRVRTQQTAAAKSGTACWH